MYFWFPLLAGLSELTFDPRPDIRYSALEVRASTTGNSLHAALVALTPFTALLSLHWNRQALQCNRSACGRY